MAETRTKTVKPVLDLDTLAPDRATVRIRTPENRKGKLYEMADLADLSIADRADLGRLQRKIEEVRPLVSRYIEGEEVDPDALDVLEDVLDRFLKLVYIDLDEETVAALNVGQKEALTTAFTQASPAAERMAAIAAKAKPQTPARRSRGSRASTEEIKGDGST